MEIELRIFITINCFYYIFLLLISAISCQLLWKGAVPHI